MANYKFVWKQREAVDFAYKEMSREMVRRARLVIDAAKTGMRDQSGFGKSVSKKKLGKDKRPHSLPGGYPVLQTGLLYRSFRVSKVSKNRWRIKNTDPIAALLEWGTKRMQARPFLKNAIRAVFGADVVIAAERKK